MTKKEKGRQWDGKSRVSNDTYRKRYKEIFGEKEEPTVEPTLSELLQEGFDKEQNGTSEETN